MSEQLSPKAIIAESIIENFEAVSSYVARQSLRDMLDENQTLRAENARLREALEAIADGPGTNGYCTQYERYMVELAQAALQPKEPSHD